VPFRTAMKNLTGASVLVVVCHYHITGLQILISFCGSGIIFTREWWVLGSSLQNLLMFRFFGHFCCTHAKMQANKKRREVTIIELVFGHETRLYPIAFSEK